VLQPGRVCGFVGEPGTGKSNLLFVLRALLDPDFDLSTADVTTGARSVSIEATLVDGRTISPQDGGGPPLLHMPVTLRGRGLVSPTTASSAATMRTALDSSGTQRFALLRALEACSAGVSGTVFAIEEPELGLPPQAHRYLRRLIRKLAESGNQVFFTTYAPGLLSIAALDEVNLVARDALGVTTVERLRPIDVDDTFRVKCEFDAERSELFFSRAAILVEGMTEKMVLPLVFQALGHDADREQISIVECGGKANLPLFIEICRRAHVPYVVVYDSDLRPPREPADGTAALNTLIRQRAGAQRTVVLEPDFEAVGGLHGKTRKPEHALRQLGGIGVDELPEPLVRVVTLALDLAQPRQRP
jgi:predicted ATP-dependent endonuclease of OLD family